MTLEPRDAEPVDQEVAGTALVVVGAAAGMGRWLVDNLFARLGWRSATVVDIEDRSSDLAAAAESFSPPARTVLTRRGSDGELALDGRLADAALDSALIVVAVPPTELAGVARRLADHDLRGSTVAVVSERLGEAMGRMAAAVPDAAVVGMHPLFERTTASIDGQLVYLVPPDRNDLTHVKLTDVVRAAGGVLTVGSAERHDVAMKYVQACTHQTLLNFVDVLTRSGLDLERDLWAARTPLFEALFGLAARVLDPRQRATIEQIQATPGAREVAAELLGSAASTSGSIADPAIAAERLDELGEHMSGSLFSTARHVAQVAVTAAQATRTSLSRYRARRELVGIRLDRRPDVLHIGHIVDVGPTEVVLEDLYVPGSGRGAVLATGPGLSNGARVGARGAPRRLSLNIGHVTVVTGSELEAELDRRLAFIRRDVRFLVPESVSGAGVLRALVDTAGTRGHSLVSEVVRTGQRAVVVRLEIRADYDIEEMVERLRAAVQQIYAWPAGICRPTTPQVRQVAFLGPPGTFSESAARQCARAARIADPALVPADDFASVLAALTGASIAVVPISSSSSGLVSRAFDALWHASTELMIGGMVDVSVRIDAYIPSGSSLEQLVGANLYSHPQAIAQCSRFVRRWKLNPVPSTSTVEALGIVAAGARPAVALAAAGTDVEGLAVKVGESEVDDLSGSITRFLIVGPPGAFGSFTDEYLPTTRTVMLGRRSDGLTTESLLDPDGSAVYEEILGDADGNVLLITSRPRPAAVPGVRVLGTSPWSPRTPVVRVAP